MAQTKQIFIHAGAHRTGSSSFQMCLHDNRATLAAAGFDAAYPGRDGIPSGDLSLPLPSPRHGFSKTDRFAAKVARQVHKQSEDPARHLILSEENIPGRMFHFYSGKFYPAAEARLSALRKGLGQATIARMVLVIRPYDQLYVSAYRKRAEDNVVDPFEQRKPFMMAMPRGWPEIIAAYRDILQPEALVVLPYAARGSSVQLLQTLVPTLQDSALQEPAEVVNLSATDAGLEALQARYHAKDVLDRADWKRIVQAHAKDTQARGFAAFNDAETAELRARFDTDVAKIADMSGVTLLA